MAEFGLGQKRAHAQPVRAAQLAFLQAGQDLVQHQPHERVAERLGHAASQTAFHFLQRLAREHVAHELLHPRQLVGAHFGVEVHLAVEHLPVLGHQHDERAVRGQRYEGYLLDAQREHRRRQHDGQAVGQARERGRRPFQKRVELGGAAAQLLDHGAIARLVGRQARNQQVVDEGTVAGVGGDAPCRRVRLRDVAAVLQHRKLVAHRRRAHAQLVALRQRARSHGQGARDVLLI